jgi:hypothetical protein
MISKFSQWFGNRQNQGQNVIQAQVGESREQAKERARQMSLESEGPVILKFNNETITFQKGQPMGPSGQSGVGEFMQAHPGDNLDDSVRAAKEASQKSGGRVTLKFNNKVIVYDKGQLNRDQSKLR